MAIDCGATSLPIRRKQLKDGMEHLRGFVTVDQDTASGSALPVLSADGEDAYGVPASLEPIRKPKTNSAENVEKRSDPFQFGSRYLEDGDDIFAYNAWDHVQVDDAYKAFAEQCYQKQKEAPVKDFDRKRFNEHPERQWDKFYSHNANNFFKNRKWLAQEFPVLKDVTREDAPATVLLEVGAGAGNTAFPILKLNKNPRLTIHACDFSKTAIEVIKRHEEYSNPDNVGRLEASVWDAAAEPAANETCSLPDGVEAGTVDVLLMVFIFSALAPEQWARAVSNAWHALKPGGLVLFRDYGRGDLAQVRFKKERWMGENFYVRGDGTRVYFFDEDELRQTWGSAGFEVASFGVDRRMLVNRQRRLKMYRCWMQAVFKKPVSEQRQQNGDHDRVDEEATVTSASTI
ncbi:uncharacterized protein PV09_06960 [Verruconis gallopava]|uniref:Methyltransferase type 12 domain-containing protein n=1 Tax=Verruconis gallopava TaxID=253628 RepID=A0A0D2A4T0_9PEZI|nr:uncharacterized protein PV09_06960 [Verruconis gallopava]KIW01788.1 hypothetical protein PV09_06960 [Verruconis gallopava]